VTLIVVYLLKEVSDFGNFSTDTGSTLAETRTDVTTNLEGSQISEESTTVPYGANFYLLVRFNMDVTHVCMIMFIMFSECFQIL